MSGTSCCGASNSVIQVLLLTLHITCSKSKEWGEGEGGRRTVRGGGGGGLGGGEDKKEDGEV
jgi:hypothetical protein